MCKEKKALRDGSGFKGFSTSDRISQNNLKKDSSIHEQPMKVVLPGGQICNHFKCWLDLQPK